MLNQSEQFVLDYIIAEGGLKEIPEAIELIRQYWRKDHYKSKNIRLKQWAPHNADSLEIIISVFTVTLMEETITYQAMVGKLNHLIKVKDSLDRFKIIADVIALISQTGLIDIVSPGQGTSILISTDYEILDIPKPDKHVILTHRPQPIESNWDPELGSMLLGHNMNHHDEEICLQHLNQLNQIPLQLNRAFVNMYTEAPRNAPNSVKAEQQWYQFMNESFGKYQEILNHNNYFYLGHKYDTRGRTYACGYHVTTQGNSYKKAIIELANEELVEG